MPGLGESVGLGQDLVDPAETATVAVVGIPFQILGKRNGRPGVLEGRHQVGRAFVAQGDGAHHGDAEEVGELLHVDPGAAGRELVEHVEDEDHGMAQLGELKGQEQGAAEVLGVGDLDDGGAGVCLQELAG